MRYKPIIGMEVHVELKTLSKMFCGCKNDPFEAKKPNIYTCPVCLGLPGALPVANKKAIDWTLKLGLALNCQINYLSKFDRKHYFYPDLPKGYQISQYDLPFCYNGFIKTNDGVVRICRVHLEEDTGKLIHTTVNGEKVSLVDFNRSGVPLIEIVTEPDIYSSSQAKEYAKKLYQIIRYLDISEADMEKGQMRLEANVSLIKEDSCQLPEYKVELKNINSFRFLEKAINSEIKRQIEILEKGKTPAQETRGYNAEKNQTFSQRSKEEAQDYRYFPEPDIPPIKITNQWLKAIKKELPEDIFSRLLRWQKDYQVRSEFVENLFETSLQADWLEKVFQNMRKAGLDSGKLVNLILHKKIKVNLFQDQPEKLVDIFKKQTVIEDVSDDQLKGIVKQVLKENPKAVEDYKKGKTTVINFLYGQVLRVLKKKVEFERVKKIIEKTN